MNDNCPYSDECGILASCDVTCCRVKELFEDFYKLEKLYFKSLDVKKERDICKRFLEIIEGELVHDYNPLASKIREIIQRCKNTIEIEAKKQ